MKYIPFIISSIILFNTTHTQTMEPSVERQQLLLAIKDELPSEIHNIIAQYTAQVMTQEFFLIAKILVGHRSPIKSLNIQDNTVKIRLDDTDAYTNIEETWDIPTSTLSSLQGNPYTTSLNRMVAFNTGIGYGPLFFAVPTSTGQKKKLRSPIISKPNPHNGLLKRLQDTLTVAQAHLIMHAYDATKGGNMFTIDTLSEEGKIFLTLEKDVRMYLLACLKIHLQKPDPFNTLDTYATNNCSIQ